MHLKKILNQPNLVGTVLIVLMVCAGFVYAIAFDGFNIETATGGEVEAWLAAAGGANSGTDPDPCDCMETYMMPADDCPPDICKSTKDCGNNKASCSSDCSQANNDKGCDECRVYTYNGITYNLHCKNNGDLCDSPEECKPYKPNIDDDGVGTDGNDRGGC